MKKQVCTLLLVLLTVLLTACSGSSSKTYDAQYFDLFDTITSITVYADDQKDADQYLREFHSQMVDYHHLYDIYHNYDGMNNLKTINDCAGIREVTVDKKIIDMLLAAKQMERETNGRMNIAMGSVLTIWHKYRMDGIENPERAEVPPYELLLEASKHTDINKVIINENKNTVYLEDPEMSLDVGAIAKGYATEMVCRSLEQDGLEHAIINVGGNVKAIGTKKDGKEWKVGIQNPDIESSHQYVKAVKMKDLSLVTSGSYQRFYTVDGIRYHHIIDPDTYMPAKYCVSVTVLCKDSGIADALSTALFNMSVEDGKQLLKKYDGVEAFWILPDGTEADTDGFQNLLEGV